MWNIAPKPQVNPNGASKIENPVKNTNQWPNREVQYWHVSLIEGQRKYLEQQALQVSTRFNYITVMTKDQFKVKIEHLATSSIYLNGHVYIYIYICMQKKKEKKRMDVSGILVDGKFTQRQQ